MTIQKDDGPRPFRKPRGRPFVPGNPGRKPGSQNKTTVMCAEMLRAAAPELLRTAIEVANAGKPQVLIFLLDRVLPKERPIKIDLSEISSPEDAVSALSAIMQAVAAGELTPSEAASVASLIVGVHRFVDIVDVKQRIQTLEAAIAGLDRKQ